MSNRSPIFATRPIGARLRASVAVFAFLSAVTSFAAPYKPSSDTVLLELDVAQQQASATRRAANSTDPQAAVELAAKFVALGRAQHDERYFGYASAALQPWSKDAQAPTPILALRADIAQHQHRFADARIILDELVARDPQNSGAWLMSATLHMTQAQPQAAKHDCQRLFALRESFAATICLAHAASINGQLPGSYRLVTTLLARLPVDDRSSKNVWALSVAADMAERSGDSAAAEQWLRKALAVAPTDLVSRLQLCDLLLQRRRPTDVLALLESQPVSEPILLRRALAEKQIGGSVAALAAWQAAVERSAQLGVTLHLRELARGQLELLGNPQLALQTALKNWEIQREPVDARLLAQAGRAAGNRVAVENVRNWQRELRFEDAGLATL